MNVEEAILELDIEQTIKELAIVCGYLQQEYKKQKELIDKIKKHCKEMITNNKYAYLSQVASKTYKARGHNEVCKEILDLIKEYEDENNNI